MTDARVLDDAPWLRSGPAARVLALLNGNGEEARVVGGAVRNALLGVAIGDLDIATTALPAEVIRRAKAGGIKSVPTGIEHGTVTLVVESKPYEVTTLREDVETFGRKARVAFGRDWARDAERRDFTINGCRSMPTASCMITSAALRISRQGACASSAIRICASPRIICASCRFFRIHAAYGTGAPDRAGYLACIKGRAGLATLSAERVRMEVMKLMIAPGAAEAVVAMADGGLLLPIFGGVAYPGPFAAMIAAEGALDLAPSAIRRLGALAVAVTEDAKRLSGRLRLTNQETRTLDSMGHRWWRLAGMDEARARRRLYRLGADRYRDRLMLAWARSGDAPDCAIWRQLATLPIAGMRRNSRSRRPISPAAALPKARRSGMYSRWRRTPGSRRTFLPTRRRWKPSPSRPSHVSTAITGFEYPLRLRRYLHRSTVAGRGHGAVRLGDRRAGRLRHRRADAAGAGADDRGRAGGADHRDLLDLHQFQPLHRLYPLCRPPPRADRDLLGGADHRARRLRLYEADRQGRGGGDRHHADPERAVAPQGEAPRCADRRPRACGRRGRLRRAGRRHLGIGRDPAVAVDGGRARGRGRDRHRRRGVARHQRRSRFRCSEWPASSPPR